MPGSSNSAAVSSSNHAAGRRSARYCVDAESTSTVTSQPAASSISSPSSCRRHRPQHPHAHPRRHHRVRPVRLPLRPEPLPQRPVRRPRRTQVAPAQQRPEQPRCHARWPIAPTARSGGAAPSRCHSNGTSAGSPASALSGVLSSRSASTSPGRVSRQRSSTAAQRPAQLQPPLPAILVVAPAAQPRGQRVRRVTGVAERRRQPKRPRIDVEEQLPRRRRLRAARRPLHLQQSRRQRHAPRPHHRPPLRHQPPRRPSLPPAAGHRDHLRPQRRRRGARIRRREEALPKRLEAVGLEEADRHGGASYGRRRAGSPRDPEPWRSRG